jgi:integrase
MAIKKLNRRSKPYRVYWRNPYTKKIQTQHFDSLRDARKHDSQVRHWLEFEPEMLAPEEEVQASGDDLTVEAIVWAYLKDRQLKPKPLKNTIYHLKAVLPEIGMVPASELSKSHMRQLVRALRDRGLKMNGIVRKVGIVKAAMNWAEDAELIGANPIQRFTCPRGTDERIPPPTTDELQSMLAVAAPHIQRVIILGLSLGVRVGPSEMFRLKWTDVDFGREVARIWSADKNAEMPWRDIPLKGSLVTALEQWWAEDQEIGAEYLVHWKGRPVQKIKKAWKATLERAGITRRIRPYDLRHAHATEALANGADLKALSENMGHSTTTMIHKHYQHVLDKQRKAAANAVPDLVIQSGNTKSAFSGDFCITDEKKIQ